MAELYSVGDCTRISGAPGIYPDREKGRTAFRKDYSRLLHAPSFRRLQGKTQLFPGHESDFFRNRLTHSLEVAQIASGIAERLNALDDSLRIDLDLVQFAGLAHDLGHPPFGHNGEKALDSVMLEFGGFEGNAQTLHILANVERKAVTDANGVRREDCGLDLCYRTLASVLKYDAMIPVNRKAGSPLEKGYYSSEASLVAQIKNAVAPGYDGPFKTIECQIMDLADDIAYSTYDLEDSMHASFVTPLSLIHALADDEAAVMSTVLGKTNKALVESGYQQIDAGLLLEAAATIFGEAGFASPSTDLSNASDVLKNALAGANFLATDRDLSLNGISRTHFTADRVGRLIGSVEYKQETIPALSKVRLTSDALMQVEILKHLNYELVIRSPRLAVVEHRGKDIVDEIFRAIRDSKGNLLPEDWKARYCGAKQVDEAACHRVICDFIAGMTDRYAIEFHTAIAGEGASIFKPL